MPFKDADIQDQFRRLLGRDATTSELADFNRFQGTGYVDLTAEDIGRILQSHPEYQQSQLGKYGQEYEGKLASSDQRILGLAQKDLVSQFAQMGRSPMSSGYVNAFASAAADLAAQRQSQLAGFYGQGYQGLMGQQVSRGNQAYGQGVGAQQAGVQRAWDITDYYRAQNDQNAYLNQANRRNKMGGLLGLGGAVAGGLIGMPGGPMGMAAGSKLGGSLGQGFGGFF